MMKSLYFLIGFLGLISSSLAATVNLAWDANAVDEDIQVYSVYEKTGATYTFLKSVPASQTAAVLNNVTVGKHTYVLTAKNIWNLESPYSDEVSTPGGSSKPSNLRVVTITVP